MDIFKNSGVRRKTYYTRNELIDCAYGKTFGAGNAQLPLPPLLMFDRITNIDQFGGNFKKGNLVAELDITPDLWFFKCHFHDDPIMPGSFGMEAIWQLTGFYLAWLGYSGKGRVLDSGTTRFANQISADNAVLRYEIHLKRIFELSDTIGIADGYLSLDGDLVYHSKNTKVGLFNI